MSVRVRMAPSPTGEFHIGGMRTFLYNWAFARKHGGSFVLRIEDTDRTRYVEGAVERLLEVVSAYSLDWDEGPKKGGSHEPYVQSQRLEIYKKYAQKLVDKGAAYYCFCSRERLKKVREEQKVQGLPITKYDKHCLSLSKEEVQAKLDKGIGYVIRLNVPKNEDIRFSDEVYGDITVNSNDIDDQVLLKSDGYPTYHLGVVVDDHLMGITHIIRGIEWLPSTPKHVLLYRALGWKIPIYAHLPVLKELGSTKKMSKRHGGVLAVDFLREGYLAQALLNFLMFLGWNPGTEKEIYSLDEFISDFSLKDIHKTDLVVFDRPKLLWLNGQYIMSVSTADLWLELKKWSERFHIDLGVGDTEEEYILGVLSLVQKRMKILSEFNRLTSYFFVEPEIPMDLLIKYAKSSEKSREILESFISLYEKVENWTAENLDKISHEALEKFGYSPKEAFMTLRVAVSGRKATPPLFDMLGLLGKTVFLNRLQKALKKCF